MASSTVGLAAASLLFSGIWYLWHVNRGIQSVPKELNGILRAPWTEEELRAAYKKVQDAPTDVRPFLYGKKGRRYVVTGGSGVVGSWIVQHLLLRGEDPHAIRILDLTPPTRPEVSERGVGFVATDLGDWEAVSKAFSAPWAASVAKLPLTVFHTVAYIKPHERKPDCMYMYQRVNINGTRHVLDAAKAAGASVCISTSSGGVGIRPIRYFFAPWKTHPDNIIQTLADVNVAYTEGNLEDYGSCYTYSKVTAENAVRLADDQPSGFRTGALRAGHLLYGHGANSATSALLNYLNRGGGPSWLHNIAITFGNGQNISIAHLAFENTLIKDPDSKVGGKIYYCSDENPPVLFRDLYKVLATLVHPMKPCRFHEVPIVPIMLLSYLVEGYELLRIRYLGFLPRVQGDLELLQPAIFQMSTIHTVYSNAAAERDLGYKAPISTLEGLCHQVYHFNQQIEAEVGKTVAQGKGGELEPESPGMVPKPPTVIE